MEYEHKQLSRSLSEAELAEIVEVYQRVGSYLQASAWFDYSSATLNRIIRQAEAEGVIPEGTANPAHRPKIDRTIILKTLEDFPWLTTAEVAARVGCSETTVYRAKKEAAE